MSQIQPPQGFTPEQQLKIVGGPTSVLFAPPQGIKGEDLPPAGTFFWIDGLGNKIIDNLGNDLVFG